MLRPLLRGAAVALAGATAVLLVQMGRADPRPLSPLLFARALALAALFHAGLFWAPDARRAWQRIAAAVAMLPATLILAGMAGEAATRVARGFPLKVLPAALASVGVIVYAVAFYFLARPARANGA